MRKQEYVVNVLTASHEHIMHLNAHDPRADVAGYLLLPPSAARYELAFDDML